MTRVTLTPILIRGAWFPCEYRVVAGKIKVLSIGDVDFDGRGPGHHATIDLAAERAFETIPDDRKLVVLIPQQDKTSDVWPCRQILKKALLAELQPVAA